MAATRTPPTFPATERTESLFAKEAGTYPTQRKARPEGDKGGEYRGYYPGVWAPRLSRLGGRPGNAHNGADIYAGYGPFPVETPIRAATGGQFLPMVDAALPDASGNRAAIHATIGTTAVYFRYGHLSRFAREEGRVEKGEVIGYAGCSGNADTAGECSEVGPCRLTSCHVHLIASLDSAFRNVQDPVAVLGWSIDYGPGADAERACGLVAPEAVPFVPARASGGLRKEEEQPRPRGRRERRIGLPAPFGGLAFDDARRLDAALASYRNLQRRLASDLTGHGVPAARFGPDLLAVMAETWIGRMKDARREPRTAMGRALEVLDHEIGLLRANADPKGLGGPATRGLLAAARALWLLTGGAAIRDGMSNRTLFDLWTSCGRSTFMEKKRIVAQNPLRGFAQEDSQSPITPPECGLGIGGKALLVASDQAQAAFHVTSLAVTPPGGTAPTPRAAVALDFGVVGLMQGIWPRDVAAALPSDATHQPARAFAEAVARCLDLFEDVYQAGWSQAAALSLTVADARRTVAAAGLAGALDLLRGALAQAHAGFLDLESLPEAARSARRALIGTLLTRIVEDAAALLVAAIAASRGATPARPVAPSFSFLALTTGRGA